MNIFTKLKLSLLAITYIIITPSTAFAQLNVFACEPEWQALVQELGGEQVSTFSATTGLQDPHQIQARPSLISKMRAADLLVCTGADLEAGWLPLLLRRASNDKLRMDQPGYFLAAEHVRLLGIPKTIDRSQGDVHAAGNPHIQTSPKNILLIANALIERMKTLDPANAEYFQQRHQHFSTRWHAAMRNWKHQIRALKGSKIIVQHASWDYLIEFGQFQQVATIEQKPGIPATSGHLVQLVRQFNQTPASVIIHAAYQDAKASQWLSERTNIPTLTLPFTVGGSATATDLFSLFDETISLLTNAILPKP
jgi:zinc/manganese transport system substrate-binding protein